MSQGDKPAPGSITWADLTVPNVGAAAALFEPAN